MHARGGEDLDLSIEQGFEVLTQTDEIEQRTSSLHVDKEVDVATPVVLTARDRTKQADVPGAVTGRNSEGSRAVCSAGPCCTDVILS